MNFQIKALAMLDIDVLKQVDRSEVVKALYLARRTPDQLGLVLERVDQDPHLTISPWDGAGIDKRISNWQPQIERGGSILAAIHQNRIVGFGILGPKRQDDDSVELCALFVSSESRGLGIGSALFQRLERLAREKGARSLLIYSNPTESSVNFYRKQGCEIIGLADKRLVSHLTWDILFAKAFNDTHDQP